MNRRTFARLGAVATTAVAGRRVLAQPEPGGNPLRMPSDVRPDDLVLTCRPGTASVGARHSADAWMYNDGLPGPTLRLTRGDPAHITLHNALSEETITHWHGLIVPEAADGHPRLAMQPGRSYDYRFTVDQPPGLYWYHPHTHMRTATQVHHGLAGLIVVDDPDVRARDLPDPSRELLMVLQDRTIASDGSMPIASFGPTMMAGFFGDSVLVNGTRDAFVSVTPDVWRLRILNASAARIYQLAFAGEDLPLLLIGADGGFLPQPAQTSHVLLAPAERVDMLVDFTQRAGKTLRLVSRPFELPAGNRGPMPGMQGMGGGRMRMMMGRQGEAMDIMQFRVADRPAGARRMPLTLPVSAPPPLPRGAREQRFVFSTMGMNHSINNATFDLDRIDVRAKAGSWERWTFVNDGPFPHPVHLHAAFFVVRQRTGGRGTLQPHETGWKDTVLVAPSEEVTVDVRFGPHPGRFLLHCHNLQHEDMGMMVNVLLD